MDKNDEKDALWRDYYELVLAGEHRAAFGRLQELAELDPDDRLVQSEISAILVELGEVPLGDASEGADVQQDELLDDIQVVSLDSVPEIFAALPREDIQSLEQSGEFRTFVPGETVFQEGDMGESMFIIKSGKALVTVESKGEPMAVATLGDGDFFGEMALLSRRPRTATVTALGELMVMEIPRDGLKHLVEKHPGITGQLAEFFNRRAQDSKQKLQADSTPGTDETAPEVEI